MVPEKGKARGRQASLYEQQEDKPDLVDTLVAKAFDSDPHVRQKVAQELGKIDDPRAIFALIELSSDKEEIVRAAAQHSLGNFKDEAEAIVSLEKLLQERKETKAQPAAPALAPATAQRMAPTLEKLFSHYEPKKRESVKRKLFPSLQKFFSFSKQELDPMRDIEKIGAPYAAQEAPEGGSEKEQSGIPSENAPNFPFGQKKEAPAPPGLEEIEGGDAEAEAQPFPEEAEKEESGFGSQSKYFWLAYRLASTPGIGKSELTAEKNRLISNFKKEVEIAFKSALEKVKEEGFASLDNIKPGMKNLSFSEMPIASILEVPYGTKKKPYLRISILDGKREIAVLVPKERGQGISVSDRLALRKVDADFLVERNEIVLVVSKKSKVIVVK